MKWVAALALVCGTAAAAAPIDPRDLPAIDVVAGAGSAVPAGPAAQVFAAGADADLVLFVLGDDFAALSGAPLDGRIEAPAAAAFDAVASRTTVIRLHRAARGVDLERHGAPAASVLRDLADLAGAGYVIAPAHLLPAITIRAHHVDARDAARAVAQLAHVELIEAHGVWIVGEPGLHLAAAKLPPHVPAHARIEINHAHPGEARRLLEPDEPQERNLCPADTWVDASLRGDTGVLESVLDALPGPPCEQHPDLAQFDTGTAALVGILIAEHRRAVFRVPGGARAFEPGGKDRVEVSYVVVSGGQAAIRPDAAAPAADKLADDLRLRATVRVGAAWTALLQAPTGEWRIVREPALQITPSSASAGERTYLLER